MKAPKLSKHLWIVGVLCLAISFGVVAQEPTAEEKVDPEAIVLVVNQENPIESITRVELERIFLKRKTFWSDGDRCVPIDQSAATEIRKRWAKLVIGKSLDETKRYWMEQAMTGQSRPPIVLDGAAIVKRYIQRIKGAIAYIPASELDETVKVVSISDLPELAHPDDTEEKEVTPPTANSNEEQS